MPYQPTNPYPYNTAIDLQDGLQFSFKVDNYDTIESFKIELYDYLENKKLYTIIRTLGDIEFVSKIVNNGYIYTLKVNETQGTVILYQNEDLLFPINNTNGKIENFRQYIEELDNTLKEKLNQELDRMSETFKDKQIIEGDSQLIQILNENEEQILLKEYTEDFAIPVTELPIKGGKGQKSIGEVDVTPYLMSIQAIEMKEYYGNTEGYEYLNVTNEGCFTLDKNGTIIAYDESKNEGDCANIVIPYKTSQGYVKNIGANVFEETEDGEIEETEQTKTKIQSVVIPSCVTFIGDEAFKNCTQLTTVNLNYGVSRISDSCFIGCVNLTNINLLDSIEFIGDNAFNSCTNLKELRLPWSLNTINEGSFSNIGVDILKLPPNLEEIKKQGFFGCESLKTVICNERLKKIEEQAFGECTALTMVNLNKQLLELGEEVFLNCNGLQKITIPENIQVIGSGILKGCNMLMELIIPFIGSKKTEEEDINNINAENEKSTSVLGHFFGQANNEQEGIEQYYCPLDEITSETKRYLIPESLNEVEVTNTTFIPYGAFSNCIYIRTIQMNNTITKICDYGFYNCTRISKIILSPNTTYIGNYAFALMQQKELD